MVRYKKPVEAGRYVEDRRGTPGRRAMGIGAGGGGIAILIAIVVAFLGGGSGIEDLGPILEQLQAPQQEQPAPAVTADPDDDMATYMAAVMADTDAMWADLFQQAGKEYRSTKTILFTGFTESGCGGADARMGPHYCPLDEQVYLDLDFFDELAARFGAAGDFAAAYVMAHEVAHHVQNVLGLSEQVQTAQQQDPSRANEFSIRLELQADCFAGVWASTVFADATGSAAVKEGYVEIDPGEIDEALEAAAAVGDDRIQIAVQGRVDPEKFNHGTAEQRVRWFGTGYESGDPGACDTFSPEASGL
jgi:uncharacterized protein